MTIGATIRPSAPRTGVPAFHAEAAAVPGAGPGATPRAALAIGPGLTVRAVIDLGYAAIEAHGIADVEELFEGFRLPLDEPVRFARYAFGLSEGLDEAGGRRIAYADKRGEVRMSVSEYAAARAAVTRLVADPRTQGALVGLYAGLVEHAAREDRKSVV